MTCGRARIANHKHKHKLSGAAVSHSAELVRGDFLLGVDLLCAR